MGTTSSKVEESSEGKERMENGAPARLAVSGRQANGSKRANGDHFPKEKENAEALEKNKHNISIRRIPKAVEGEQIAAGWPSWLAEVAGEAINGWVPLRPYNFEKMAKIGQGTYSNVYKARDCINGRIVALKKVRFDNLEPESLKFMAREILILRSLDHPNVIKLEGLITSNMASSLYLVFEYMEHDLTGIASLPGVKFTEPQVKCHMHQLLTGLEYCHSRGVLHRDIKCSNLLLDNHGKLKIADFGLSTFYDNHQNIALTNRVVTLWYRPPELLLGEVHYGVAVDLWSTGCVLGELYAGKPIMPGRTEVEQLHKIYKLCGSPSDDYWRKSKLPNAAPFKPQQPYRSCLAETFKDISPTAFDLLVKLLSLDPEHRGTATSALQSEFFRTEPLACDLSSLPKYPPSKEVDGTFQQREAYRSRVMGAPIHTGPDFVAGLTESMEFLQFDWKKPSSPLNILSVLKKHKHHIQDAARRARLEKISMAKMPKAHNLQKTGAAQQRLEKVMVGKIQAPVSETKTNLAYSGLSRVPSNNEVRLCKEHDHHVQKVAEGACAEKIREKSLDRVSAAEVYSGPQAIPSYNVDQSLEEHDRQIQESAQEIKNERRRATKIQVQESQIKDQSIPSVPLFAPISNVDDLLEEHDRQIQESTERLICEKKRAYKVKP